MPQESLARSEASLKKKVFDDFLTMAKVETEDPEIIGDRNCHIAKFRECYVSDGHKAIVQEGIHQVGRNLECFGEKGISAILEVIIGSILDHVAKSSLNPR